MSLKKAEQWRKRAEELRIIAESTTDEDARRTLQQCAQDYEQMAENQEKIHRFSQKKTSRHQ